jgi:hypothetical protein
MINPLPYTPLEHLDRVPSGWFVLDVMKKDARKWDWVALIADVELDDLKHYQCAFPALFFVHPKDYKPGLRKVSRAWFRIPGKHKNRDLAWDALCDLMETRH